MLFTQIVAVPMSMNCVSLVAYLFLFCKKRDFMMFLSEEKPSEVIEASNSTSRYLDDLLNIDINYFDGLFSQIYPSELQLNKTNSSETKTPFLDLHLSILDGFIPCKFMINAMILIFTLQIFLTWVGMLLVEHPMIFIYRN